ncbi:DUF805 domain-containing protein [Salirhabdus salicampi]|uniref:DUF805 domain-containing protein n=1 Tax=Salirhabdus salicampi TaxID=476102 RepID=UPI0020C59E6F|nr:DUF805 domain-containing protein [Salirhabdus salicampi]MCP8617363.1 DUF805 domain-containing protein [Salirhabdus salicampi]
MYWFLKVLKNYSTFSGRARRKEYWMFVLYNAIFGVLLSVLELVINLEGVLTTFYGLALLLPALAVTVRRLHDIGKNGWWYLLMLVPIVGAIMILIFTCLDSQEDENRFGPNPKLHNEGKTVTA